MTAACVRRLVLLLALVCAAGGCHWARQVTRNPSPREDDQRYPHEPAKGYFEQDNAYRRDVRDQRALNEADFQARNPGGKR